MPCTLSFEALFDGVLVRARESREDEFTSVGVPWMDRKIVALSDDIYGALDVAEVEIWWNALAVKIESEIDQVDIPCSFTVSKKAAFYAIRSCKDA